MIEIDQQTREESFNEILHEVRKGYIRAEIEERVFQRKVLKDRHAQHPLANIQAKKRDLADSLEVLMDIKKDYLQKETQ